MTVIETRPCPQCTSWGWNEPVPDCVKAFRYSDLCAAHRGPKVKQRSRKTLTNELSRAFTWWLISLEDDGLKKSTVETHRRSAARFARWWLDQMPPEPEE